MILSGSIVSHKTKAVEGLITPGCSDPKGISVVERRCWLFLSRPFTEKIITVVTMTVDADSLSRMKHAGFIAEGALSPGLVLCICNLNTDISSQENIHKIHQNIADT